MHFCYMWFLILIGEHPAKYCFGSFLSSIRFLLSLSEPSVMDRLIALEKLMMCCQDKDGLGMLKDVAQSRREIQVSHSTRMYRQQQVKCAEPHVRSDWFFYFIRSWKRSKGSWKTRPFYSVGWLERRPAPKQTPSGGTLLLLCRGNSQLQQKPTDNRLWSNPYKVGQNQRSVLIFTIATCLISPQTSHNANWNPVFKNSIEKTQKYFSHFLHHDCVVPRSHWC